MVPGWKTAPFDEFLVLQRGQDLTKAQFESGDVPVAGSNGVIGYHNAANVASPGVTVGRSGSVGKVSIYHRPFWAHNTCLYVRDFHGNDEVFSYYFLQYLDVGRFKSGASVPTLDRNTFRFLPVAFPPLGEQRQIARVLSAVQRAIERQERLIALTAELKKALMHNLFTEGTRGEPLKQTEIGPVPESWEIRRLADLLREPVRNGHSAKETPNPDGIRTLTLTAITRADFSLANTKTTVAVANKVRNLWLQRGDVFIQRANTLDYVGLAALYEGPKDFAIFPDLLVRIRLREDEMLPKVLAEYLISPRCRRYFRMNAKGTAGNFPKIDQGIIEKLQVPLPLPSEQSEIEHAARTLDRKHAAHVAMRKGYEDLFRTLLDQLMTAQIRVCDLDLSALEEPAAEPAGVT